MFSRDRWRGGTSGSELTDDERTIIIGVITTKAKVCLLSGGTS